MQQKRLLKLQPLPCADVVKVKVGDVDVDREVAEEEFVAKEEGQDMQFSEGKSVVHTVGLMMS
jgi:hypothetical protein